jgi:hypothetical protein
MAAKPDWTAKQLLVATSIASGLSIRAAARKAGVGERTAYRWHAESPGFAALVAKLRDATLNRTVGKLVKASTRAAEALAQLIKSPDEVIRLRACTAILDAGIRVRDHAEVLGRLTELESTLAERGEQL